MPFQSVPNAAEVVIHGTVGGKPVANVLGFQFASAYSQSDLDALAVDCDAVVAAQYKPIMTAGMSYDGVFVRGLTNENDLSSSHTSGAGAGGVSGAQLNNNVTLCVTLRTGRTGRSARGRFYAFPTGASQLSAANQFSSGYGIALVAFLEQVRIDAASDNWLMCIISRFHNKVLRTPAVTFIVTDIGTRNLISDSQRGRLPVGH